MVRESHGIHVSKTYGTSLIAEIRYVDGNRGRFGVNLVVARSAVQAARGNRGFVITDDFSFPPPLAGIFGNERGCTAAVAAKLDKVDHIVPDFITSVSGFSAFFT